MARPRPVWHASARRLHEVEQCAIVESRDLLVIQSRLPALLPIPMEELDEHQPVDRVGDMPLLGVPRLRRR